MPLLVCKRIGVCVTIERRFNGAAFDCTRRRLDTRTSGGSGERRRRRPKAQRSATGVNAEESSCRPTPIVASLTYAFAACVRKRALTRWLSPRRRLACSSSTRILVNASARALTSLLVGVEGYERQRVVPTKRPNADRNARLSFQNRVATARRLQIGLLRRRPSNSRSPRSRRIRSLDDRRIEARN